MKITIESTNRILQIKTDSGDVPARLWEGTTASGVKVECLITRIAARDNQDLSQFERELTEHRPPQYDQSAWPPQGIPLRLIL